MKKIFNFLFINKIHDANLSKIKKKLDDIPIKDDNISNSYFQFSNNEFRNQLCTPRIKCGIKYNKFMNKLGFYKINDTKDKNINSIFKNKNNYTNVVFGSFRNNASNPFNRFLHLKKKGATNDIKNSTFFK